jgi:hypothetical protein
MTLPAAARRCQETAVSLNVVSGHVIFHYADSDIVRRLVVDSAMLGDIIPRCGRCASP